MQTPISGIEKLRSRVEIDYGEIGINNKQPFKRANLGRLLELNVKVNTEKNSTILVFVHCDAPKNLVSQECFTIDKT